MPPSRPTALPKKGGSTQSAPRYEWPCRKSIGRHPQPPGAGEEYPSSKACTADCRPDERRPSAGPSSLWHVECDTCLTGIGKSLNDFGLAGLAKLNGMRAL